ncbi:MAG: SDR family NAD(P)-dependent oxidoreductase [Promethearchaeota archaeon]
MVDLLKDKIAIITGSGRGIGKAIAELYVQEGAKVTINDIDADVCKATAKELNDKYGNGGEVALACVADVTKWDQVQKMVEDTVAKFGNIHILVNCAGLTRDALVHKMSDFEYRLIVDINLKGTILCSKAVLPYFLKEERDEEFKKIINFASTTGVSGNFGQANYSMAKGGVIGFTKALAREVASNRICVNCVAPGFTETRMTAEKKPGDKLGMPKALRQIAIQGIPFSRHGKGGLPRDVARICLFFASYLSDWITGQLLISDGGQYI